jgi:hypothetical protein
MDAARREQMVRGRIAELRTWLNSPAFRDAASSGRDAVERRARQHDQSSFLSMLSTAAALPWFSLARGVRDVIDGRETGWSEIRDSIDLLHWWRRGILAAAEKERVRAGGGNIGLVYYTFSHACLLALAISDAETAGWFAKQALKMVEDGTAQATAGEMGFPEFVGSVCREWLGSAVPPALSMTSKPDALFTALKSRDDDAQLTDSLPALLDYHMIRCDKSSATNPDPKYQQPGLSLLPTPAYAILALRRKSAKGDLPDVNHPLAALPTWTPPRTSASQDALIPLVAERVRRLESGKY